MSFIWTRRPSQGRLWARTWMSSKRTASMKAARNGWRKPTKSTGSISRRKTSSVPLTMPSVPTGALLSSRETWRRRGRSSNTPPAPGKCTRHFCTPAPLTAKRNASTRSCTAGSIRETLYLSVMRAPREAACPRCSTLPRRSVRIKNSAEALR